MHISELTADELRDILRKVVEEILDEKRLLLADPDADFELHAEVAESLHQYLTSHRRGDDVGEVFKALGIGDWPIESKLRKRHKLI
jgi:hypothetical protein